MLKLLDCGHTPSPHESFTTGYGKTADGKTLCYECCAKMDRAEMVARGRATLYLTHDPFPASYPHADGKVTNWPGSLAFSCRVKRGRHNIARTRYDVWFTGPDEKPWHGVQYGDMTQICHCKRMR